MVFLKREEEEYDLHHLLGCNPAKKRRSLPAGKKQRPRCNVDNGGFLRPPAVPLHQAQIMTRFDWLLHAAEIARQELEKEEKIALESPPDASSKENEKKKENKRKRKASASPPHPLNINKNNKKRKTSNNGCLMGAVELPAEFRRKVREMGGKEDEAVLVIQKKLFPSDVAPNNGRFSIPSNQVANDFLTPQEKHCLESGMKIYDILMIEPDATSVGPINLAKWDMSANGTYNLITNWNAVRKRNGLVKGDLVQLWAFRTHSPSPNLCLAMLLLR